MSARLGQIHYIKEALRESVGRARSTKLDGNADGIMSNILADGLGQLLILFIGENKKL